MKKKLLVCSKYCFLITLSACGAEKTKTFVGEKNLM